MDPANLSRNLSQSCWRSWIRTEAGFSAAQGERGAKYSDVSPEQNSRPLFHWKSQETEKGSRLLFFAVIARGRWYFRFRLLLTVKKNLLLLLHGDVGIIFDRIDSFFFFRISVFPISIPVSVTVNFGIYQGGAKARVQGQVTGRSCVFSAAQVQ